MQTMGIKDLQVNPATLTHSLEINEYTIITKRSKPIGMAISFNDDIVTKGLRTALMLDAYKKNYLSLGQLSKSLEKTKKETMLMLSLACIDVIDYDFKDDLNFVDSLA